MFQSHLPQREDECERRLTCPCCSNPAFPGGKTQALTSAVWASKRTRFNPAFPKRKAQEAVPDRSSIVLRGLNPVSLYRRRKRLARSIGNARVDLFQSRLPQREDARHKEKQQHAALYSFVSIPSSLWGRRLPWWDKRETNRAPAVRNISIPPSQKGRRRSHQEATSFLA